jgi:PAS domain S-box-containing protein
MENDKNKSADAAEIRSRPEEHPRENRSEKIETRTESDTQRYIHGPHVHQTELDMQNAELEQAKKLILENEEFYRSLVDSVDVGIMLVDTAHNIIMFNKKHAEILNSSPDKLIGKKCYRELERREDVCPHCPGIKAIASGLPAEVEVTGHGKDGSPFAICIKASPIFTRDGKVSAFVEVVEDISQRKRREEEIAWLAKFPSENPNPIFRIGKDCTILYRNKAGESLLESLRSHDGYDLPGLWRQCINDALSSGCAQQSEYDWDRHVLDLSFTPVVEAGYVNVYVLDITARKRAEELLRESENRYQRLFHEAVEGICLVDLETGVIHDCNQAFLDLTGFDRMELIGEPEALLYPKESLNRRLSYIFALQKSQNQEELLDSEIITKSNSVKEAQIKASVVEFEGRRFVQGFFRDISHERRTQRERETSLALLGLLNDRNDTHELIRKLTDFLQERTGCEAIGVRLREGDDYPYFETRGFPQEFVRAENYLCARDHEGQVIRDSVGYPILECMCGNILCGRFNPELPFFTNRGSFWTNCTTELLASTTEADRQSHLRNRCNSAGYESVALIALRHGNQTLGLLQVNDRRKNRFTPELITFLENTADQIAIALAQRQAQAALQLSEQRFRDISEAAGEYIWELDLNGCFTYISERVESVVGYRPEDLLGRQSTAFVRGDENPPKHKVLMAEFCNSKKGFRDAEYCVTNKFGRPVWLSATAVPVFGPSGELTGYRGATLDITERKQAERLVRESEDMYRSLVEASPMAVTVSDLDGKILIVNQLILELYGYAAESDLIGRNIFDWVPPDEIGRAQQEFNRLIVGGTNRTAELTLTRANGDLFPAELNAVVINDNAGQPRHIIFITTDITERKRREETIARLMGVSQQLRIIMASMNGCSTIEETFVPLLENALILCDMDGGGIYLIEKDVAVLRHHSGLQENFIRVVERMPLAHPALQAVANADGPVDVISLSEEIGELFRRCGLRHVYSVPLRADGTIFGFLNLASTRTETPAPLNIQSLWVLAIEMESVFCRLKAEEMLRDRKNRLAGILKTAPIGIGVVSNRILKETNLRFCEMVGYSAVELLEQSVRILYQTDEEYEYVGRENFAQIQKFGRTSVETRWQRKDGAFVDILLNCSPIDPLIPSGDWTFMAIDITESKRAGETLRKNEAMLSCIVNSVPQSIFWKDRNGVCLGCNQVYARTLGLDAPESVFGKTDLELGMPPHEVEHYLADDREVMEKRQPKKHIVEPLQQADGTRIWIDTTKVPLLDADGNAYGVLGVSEDITERKRTEEALVQSESRFRSLFYDSPMALFESDYTEVGRYLDRLRAAGVTDLCEYFQSHPEAVRQCAAMVKILDVNQAALTLHQAASKQMFLDGLPAIFVDESYNTFHKVLLAVIDRKTVFELEAPIRTLQGEKRQILLRWAVAPGSEETMSRVYVSHTDITECKRTEDALVESERRYHSLFDTINEGFALHDIICNADGEPYDYRFLEINPAFETLTGLKREIILGKTLREILPGEDPAFINIYGEVALSGKSVRFDNYSTALNKHFEVFAYQPAPNRFATLFVDVSDYYKSQEALRDSEERYRRLFEAESDAVFLIDCQTCGILDANESAVKLYGYSKEELLFLKASDISAEPAKTIQAIATDVTRVPLRWHRKKDGAVFPVEIVSNVFEYHGRKVHVAAFRDITERKQTEQRLQESEKRLRLTLEATQICIWDWDIKYDRWYVSPIYYAMLGCEPSTTGLEDRNEMLERIHPEDRAYVSEKIQDVLTNYVNEYQYEARIRHADGTYRWHQVRGFSVERDPDGKVNRLLGIRMDITDRKRALEELQQMQAHLAHVARLSTMGEIVAGIAHEVNQPLFSIVNYAKACNNLLAQKRPALEKLNDWCREIAVEAARTGQIIQRVRDFVRKHKLERSPKAINELVAESVEIVAFEINRRHISIQSQFIGSNPQAIIDHIQIQQVLVNLLLNACDALSENTVENRKLLVRTALSDNFIEVSVADNGSGLKVDEASRIFEPFVTTKPQGLGMGLAISKTIVEAHGGKIWAASNSEGGATFHFTLPAAMTNEKQNYAT